MIAAGEYRGNTIELEADDVDGPPRIRAMRVTCPDGHSLTRADLNGLVPMRFFSRVLWEAAAEEARAQITDTMDMWEQTAIVYRAALRAGHPPTLAVMQWFDITRSPATARMRRAQQMGYFREDRA